MYNGERFTYNFVCALFFLFPYLLKPNVIFVACSHLIDKEIGFESKVIYRKMVFKVQIFLTLTSDSQFWLHIRITWRTSLNYHQPWSSPSNFMQVFRGKQFVSMEFIGQKQPSFLRFAKYMI